MADDKLYDEPTLKKLLKKAAIEPINFAFGIGDDPSKHVLVMHLKKNPKKLFETIKKEKGLKKGTWGTAQTDDRILILNIEKKAPALPKNVKLFLKTKKWKQKQASILFHGQEVSDDIEDDATQDAGTGTEPQAPSAALVKTFTQVGAAWAKTRDIVQKDLKKLQKAILIEFKDVPGVKKLVGSVKQLDSVLDRLDDRLTKKLDEAAKSRDMTEASERRKEANKLIEDYLKYVNRDPLVKNIDKNPFVKLSVQKVLSSSLKALGAKLAS